MFHEKVRGAREILYECAAQVDDLRGKLGREMSKCEMSRESSKSETSKSKKTQALLSRLDKCIPRVHIARLDDIEARYKISTVDVILRYYQGGEPEHSLSTAYYSIVNSEGCFSALDVIISSAANIARAIDACHKHPTDLLRKIERLQMMDLVHPLETDTYDLCECGKNMVIHSETSELQCKDCGICKPILGAVFSDDQFFPQEGQKSKHGDYAPARHGKFWLERLLAEEATTGILEFVPAIRAVVLRDRYCSAEITCELMRNILKELKLTALNDHVPSLIKLVGGRPPPSITRSERRSIEVKLNKVMDLYPIVCPENKNKPYYPYFIYKIVEWDFRNDREKLRLLDYIHLQSDETVTKNDGYLKLICELLEPEDDLPFNQTNV